MRALRQFALAQGLSEPELKLLVEIANRAQLDPMLVATRINLFEKATAMALAKEPPTLDVARGSVPALLRSIRTKLQFDPLPIHYPLTTSRELQVGAALTLKDKTGTVVEVNEAFFRVELHALLEVFVGTQVAVRVARHADALYEFDSKLLSVERNGEGCSLCFAHSESPRRVQNRKYARVEITGDVSLTVVPSELFSSIPVAVIKTHLANISAGGMLVRTPESLPRGLTVKCTFALGQLKLTDLLAVVVSSDKATAPHSHDLHLEFIEISEAERERLATWVVRHSAN